MPMGCGLPAVRSRSVHRCNNLLEDRSGAIQHTPTEKYYIIVDNLWQMRHNCGGDRIGSRATTGGPEKRGIGFRSLWESTDTAASGGQPRPHVLGAPIQLKRLKCSFEVGDQSWLWNPGRIRSPLRPGTKDLHREHLRASWQDATCGSDGGRVRRCIVVGAQRY
jgi:hypothetical protein